MTMNLFDPVRNPTQLAQNPVQKSNALQAINQGFGVGVNALGALETLRGQKLKNEASQAAAVQSGVVNRDLLNKENITNTVNRLQTVERQIGFGATAEQLAETLQGFIAESQANGGNPVDSIQALQALQQGGVPALNGLLGQAKQVFQQQGLIVAPASVSTADAFAKIDPSKFTPESVSAFQTSGKFGDLMPVSADDVDPEYIKELRSELRTETGTLQKQAGVLKSNFEKLQNLTGEIEKGNRSAVAQALVSLVKLGDPTSVVKDSEMEAALNAENPLAAVSSALKGTNDETSSVIQSLIRKIDPLSPETVDTGELLATANAMLSPNVNSIVGAYDVAKSRAQEQLTKDGLSSIFGKARDDLFNDVRGLSPAQQDTPVAALETPLVSQGGVQFKIISQ